MNESRRLILASASPRRRELLAEAGYRFDVLAAELDEAALSRGLAPPEVALTLAEAKARATAEKIPDAWILAADTVVVLHDRLLGKPTDAADAVRMLGDLSGTTHQVITGVALYHLRGGWQEAHIDISTVSMRPLTESEIHQYVQSGQWRGKAGGYGLQDPDPFVRCVSGSASNIVGLPMELTSTMLARAGLLPGATHA